MVGGRHRGWTVGPAQGGGGLSLCSWQLLHDPMAAPGRRPPPQFSGSHLAPLRQGVRVWKRQTQRRADFQDPSHPPPRGGPPWWSSPLTGAPHCPTHQLPEKPQPKSGSVLRRRRQAEAGSAAPQPHRPVCLFPALSPWVGAMEPAAVPLGHIPSQAEKERVCRSPSRYQLLNESIPAT